MTWRIQGTISGIPRTKKTSNRVIHLRGRPVVLPSAAWVKWVKEAEVTLDFLDPTMQHTSLPIAEPIWCSARIYRDANRGDLIGYLQGLADLLEKRGIVQNDKWIVSWDGSRMDKDAKNPRIELKMSRPL